MYKFYRTVPVYIGNDNYPTGETVDYEYEVSEDELSEFNEWLNKNGLMIKGTNRIVSKPKKCFLSRLCDIIKESLSD